MGSVLHRNTRTPQEHRNTSFSEVTTRLQEHPALGAPLCHSRMDWAVPLNLSMTLSVHGLPAPLQPPGGSCHSESLFPFYYHQAPLLWSRSRLVMLASCLSSQKALLLPSPKTAYTVQHKVSDTEPKPAPPHIFKTVGQHAVAF